MLEVLYVIGVFVLSAILLYFVFWLYILLPMEMANDRNRSPVAWVLVSIALSPVAAILLLLFFGEAEKSDRVGL